jgi:surfeit locus 1 family protein
MLRGYSFRPRGWQVVAAAVACALFITLGNWQSRRGAEKRELAAALDRAASSPPTELPAGSADLVHKRVSARGHFVPERTVLLDNKLRRGRPGYEVVAPLRIDTSPWHVLVNRGWIAAPATRDQLPDVRTPAGQNLDVAEYGAETGLQFLPIVIEQHSDLDDGLVREWPRADFGVEKHQSYALQWYSFAALAVVLAVALSFRRVAQN